MAIFRRPMMIAMTCVAVMGLATPSAAQDARPPAEFGIGLGALLTVDYEDFLAGGPDQAVVDLRLTLPFTPRFAFEGLVTIGRRDTEFTDRTDTLKPIPPLRPW